MRNISGGDLFETNTATRFVDAGELAGATAANGLSYNGAGTRVTSETTIAASAVTSFVDADNVDSFADLAVALGDSILTASGSANSSNVNYNVVTIADDAATNINGTYIIVNNTNNILDSGDLMFRVGNGTFADSATETAAVEVDEGESLDEIKAKLKPKKKGGISADLLDTANTYDDKVALVRMIVTDEAGRVANVFKQMMRDDLELLK